jgi:hypothetical protein
MVVDDPLVKLMTKRHTTLSATTKIQHILAPPCDENLVSFVWYSELKVNITTNKTSLHSACLLHACLASNEQKTGGNCSWHDFASSILMSRIFALCLYGAIHLCIKHMARFLASSESSPRPKQMEFHMNFQRK